MIKNKFTLLALVAIISISPIVAFDLPTETLAEPAGFTIRLKNNITRFTPAVVRNGLSRCKTVMNKNPRLTTIGLGILTVAGLYYGYIKLQKKRDEGKVWTAIKNKEIETVKKLYKSDMNLNQFYTKSHDHTQRYAFGVVIDQDDTEMIKFLLENKIAQNTAVLYSGNKGRYSALGHAINREKKDIITCLFVNKASQDEALVLDKNPKAFGSQRTVYSSLGCAIKNGNLEIVKLAIANNASQNRALVYENGKEFTALGLAVSLDKFEIARCLTEQDVVMINEKGKKHSARDYVKMNISVGHQQKYLDILKK